MTTLVLTAAGRTALTDANNVATQAVTLTRLALGDDTRAADADDDARTALRSQEDIEDVTGSTTGSRIAVRASFTPTEAYSVTEVGLFARVGASGTEFLFAYWAAVTDSGDAIATTATDATLIVAGVVEIVASNADVDVTVGANIAVGVPADVVRNTDRASTTARGIVELATGTEHRTGTDEERALTAKSAADAIGGAETYPALRNALRGALYAASESHRGTIRLATEAQADAGVDTEGAMTSALVARRVAALIDSSPEALNTLKELADALGNDANFAATVNAALAERATTTALAAAIAAEVTARNAAIATETAAREAAFSAGLEPQYFLLDSAGLRLYRLDVTDGSLSLIDIFSGYTGTLYPRSIAVGPGGTMYLADGYPGERLFTVDLSDASLSAVGAFSGFPVPGTPPAQIQAIGFSSEGSGFLMTDGSSAFTRDRLWHLNPSDPSVVVVGYFGAVPSARDIAFSAAGQLYLLGTGRLYTLDRYSASKTLLGSSVGAYSKSILVSRGAMYAVRSSTVEHALYTLDAHDGTPTKVADFSGYTGSFAARSLAALDPLMN